MGELLVAGQLAHLADVGEALAEGLALLVVLCTVHLLLVVPTDSHKGQDVADNCGLDPLVEAAGGAQRGQHVDLDQPGLEFLVDEDVEAEQLEAAGAAVRRTLLEVAHDVRLHRDQGLYNDIFHLSKHEIVVEVPLFKGLSQFFKVPFVASLHAVAFFLTFFSTSSLLRFRSFSAFFFLTNLEHFAALVNRKVC